MGLVNDALISSRHAAFRLFSRNIVVCDVQTVSLTICMCFWCVRARVYLNEIQMKSSSNATFSRSSNVHLTTYNTTQSQTVRYYLKKFVVKRQLNLFVSQTVDRGVFWKFLTSCVFQEAILHLFGIFFLKWSVTCLHCLIMCNADYIPNWKRESRGVCANV
jgi:hypothetical protein